MKIINMVFVVFLFAGCAKVGSPIGGTKDTRPPVYLRGVPENRSINVKEKVITFWFDEYIQFKDLTKELLVSPPLKEKPVIRIKDKSVRVDLMNDLLPNTTYTINFGKAISDLNEGNLLPDFEFVFSTGDVVDSLAVTGIALNAFDHKPLKDAEILVMLYEDLSDSAPLLKIPRYIGRAGSNGLFAINNIHPDTGRIFAINDVNGNLRYDQGSESMAFLDTFLILNANTVKAVNFIKDTIKVQKVAKRKEKAEKQVTAASLIDTTVVQGKKLNATNVTLYYFIEETNEVYLSDRKRDMREKLNFVFSRPPHDSVRIKPLNYNPIANWFVRDASTRGDTLTYWITDSLMAKKDTLIMTISYTSTDTLGRLAMRTDTIRLRYQVTSEKGTGAKKGKSGSAVKKALPGEMTLSTSIAPRGMQNLDKPVVFTTNKPVSAVHRDSMELSLIEDSISRPQPFTIVEDTNSVRKIRLDTKWKENSHYRLFLKPNAIQDIYGNGNDSLDFKFTTQKSEYYGRIIITAGGSKFPVILQVLDQKDRLAGSRVLKKPGKIIMDFLPPEKYTLKAIIDRNNNGRWDTGNYFEHSQPEQVFFYQLPVELRSNWDYEVNWEIPD